MRLGRIIHWAAKLARPVLNLLGVKEKTLAGKLPPVLETADKLQEEEKR